MQWLLCICVRNQNDRNLFEMQLTEFFIVENVSDVYCVQPLILKIVLWNTPLWDVWSDRFIKSAEPNIHHNGIQIVLQILEIRDKPIPVLLETITTM